MSDSEDEIRNQDLFDSLSISTISMNGSIAPLDPDEREDIKRFRCVGRIVEISNNFYTTSTPAYEEYKKANEKKPRDVMKGQRDRNEEERKKSRSESKGTNTHQSSQITFVIQSKILDQHGNPRFYKIKLFRKGAVQIPGVIDESYEDIGDALNLLVNYLRKAYKNDNIAMVNLYTSMKNYVCRLVYGWFRFNLNKLKLAFDTYKTNSPFKIYVVEILDLLGFPKDVPKEDLDDDDFHSSDDDDYIDLGLPRRPIPSTTVTKKVNRYTLANIRDIIRIQCGHTQEQIAEVIKETDKSVSSLSIKFYQSAIDVFHVARDKEPKRTTIKIMQSGKINFEGGNDYAETVKLREWLMQFIRLRQNEVMGHIRKPYDETAESSDSGESIYADFDPVYKKKKTRI